MEEQEKLPKTTVHKRITENLKGKEKEKKKKADWKYTRIYNPQRRLRVLVIKCRTDPSQRYERLSRPYPAWGLKLGPVGWKSNTLPLSHWDSIWLNSRNQKVMK
ncbi:hypothetical protein TNCV_4018111 [Trichonephila clavipes]|nr:hypothetical protein TNCV_4018111 [Trichonephila clavipes]